MLTDMHTFRFNTFAKTKHDYSGYAWERSVKKTIQKGQHITYLITYHNLLNFLLTSTDKDQPRFMRDLCFISVPSHTGAW